MNRLELNMKLKNIVLVFSLLAITSLQGQDSMKGFDSTHTTVSIVAPNGDTLHKRIAPVIVTDKRATRTPEEEEAYQKLKRKVIKLYPYALLAKQIYEETNANMNSLESNKEKRKFKKQKEQELLQI